MEGRELKLCLGNIEWQAAVKYNHLIKFMSVHEERKVLSQKRSVKHIAMMTNALWKDSECIMQVIYQAGYLQRQSLVKDMLLIQPDCPFSCREHLRL